MDGLLDGWTHGRTDGRTDGWMAGRMLGSETEAPQPKRIALESNPLGFPSLKTTLSMRFSLHLKDEMNPKRV